MDKVRIGIFGAAAAVFMVGTVVISQQGKPVVQNAAEYVKEAVQPALPAEAESPIKQPEVKAEAKTLTFTMATVAQHATPADCWAAINGSVYDLSTWVSRHPGGTRPIEGLCGKDGTAKFTRKHGKSSAAQAALALLKIGTLAQ